MRPVSVVRPAAALLLVALILGCARDRAPVFRYADVWRSAAPADSVSLERYLALPAGLRSSRREAADGWSRLADSATDEATRLGALAAAVGLAPGEPRYWFAYAAEAARLGDDVRALALLDGAEPAVRGLSEPARERARVRLYLDRGWAARDRGRWTQSHAWADSAARISPAEREVKMLLGLARAAHGDLRGALNVSRDIETKQYFHFEWRWIRGMAELARGRADNAYYWLHGTQPEGPWAARYHRDLGLICERLGDDVGARRYYSWAYSESDLLSGACPGPVDVELTAADGKRRRLPVWIALGRLQVSGSLFGWATAATDSFRAAAGEATRTAWADRAVEALGVAIRHQEHELRCLALRGAIFDDVGADRLALPDLRKAARAQEARGDPDPDTFARLGALLNREGMFAAAAERLRTALAAEPRRARAWSDLGYSLLMTGREEEGEQALDRALELDPDLADAWYNRGLSRYRAQRWDEAVADLTHARDLAPDNPEILSLLQQASLRARREKPGREPSQRRE